jgi:hypothetical protein
MADIGNRPDVTHIQPRIGRRLQKERLGVGPPRLRPGLGVAGIHRRRLDAEARQYRIHQHPAAAEQCAPRHQMVPGRQLAQQRRRHRRHAARRRTRRLSAFDQRQPLLQHLHGRVLKPAVGHPRPLAAETCGGLLGIVIAIATGQEDRFRGLAIFGARGAATHRKRGGTPSGGMGRVLAGQSLHAVRDSRPAPTAQCRAPAPPPCCRRFIFACKY